MEFDPYNVRMIQLKGYLKEYFVKPDMSDTVWKVADFCMSHPSHGMFGFKFSRQLEMLQFGLACLLSCGKQLSWVSSGSYWIVQKNLDNSILLTDYVDYDVVFILHAAGTMRNSIMGDMLSQVGVIRGLKKTFFFDVGGYPIQNLSYRVSTVQDAFNALGGFKCRAASRSVGIQPGEEDFNI
jgi:hypothetical protein